MSLVWQIRKQSLREVTQLSWKVRARAGEADCLSSDPDFTTHSCDSASVFSSEKWDNSSICHTGWWTYMQNTWNSAWNRVNSPETRVYTICQVPWVVWFGSCRAAVWIQIPKPVIGTISQSWPIQWGRSCHQGLSWASHQHSQEVVNVLGPGYSLLFLLNQALAVGGCKETRGQYQQVIGVDDATFFPERKSFTAQHVASKPLEHVLTSIPVPHFPLCSRSSARSLLRRPPAKPLVHHWGQLCWAVFTTAPWLSQA